MQLNSRQREIVTRMLHAERLQLNSCMKDYKVSRRTVYKDIAAIKAWAEEAGVTLKSSTHCLLEVEDEKDIPVIQRTLQVIIPYSTPLNQLSRSNLILAHLLFEDETFTVQQLCDHIGISRSTFYRDLEFVKEWLNHFDIHLEITKTKGVEVDCRESKIREAMVFFIKRNFDNYDLLGILQTKRPDVYFKNEKILIFDLIREYFKGINIQQVVDIVCKIEFYQGFQFLDKDNIFLIWIILVSLSRIARHCAIEENDKRFNEVDSSQETKLIASGIQSVIDQTISEAEYHYLFFHLMSLRNRFDLIKQDNFDLDYKIMQLIEAVSYRLCVSLITDVKLIEGLKIHLANTLDRIKLEVLELNPLKEQIMERYPLVFEICKDELKKSRIFKQDISDDEISYIVIYIAAAMERASQSNKRVYAVCTTGSGSAELLLANLQNKFPDLDVLGTISIQKAVHLTRNQADAIISTTYFHNDEVPVIAVSPLLLNDDVKQIRRELMIEAEENVYHFKVHPDEEAFSFMDSMYLLTDCATALDELIIQMSLKLENNEYIGMLIHLMMQIYQSAGDEFAEKENLNAYDLIIFQVLSKLYQKYSKRPSVYDIKSIKTYLSNRKETNENPIY